MKIFSLVLFLFSFSAVASTLDCRERTANGDTQYVVQFEGNIAVQMTVNGYPYHAIHKYDGNTNSVTVIAETETDVFELSFESQPFYEDQFIIAQLLSYYMGPDQVRCRYKN